MKNLHLNVFSFGFTLVWYVLAQMKNFHFKTCLYNFQEQSVIFTLLWVMLDANLRRYHEPEVSLQKHNGRTLCTTVRVSHI